MKMKKETDFEKITCCRQYASTHQYTSKNALQEYWISEQFHIEVLLPPSYGYGACCLGSLGEMNDTQEHYHFFFYD